MFSFYLNRWCDDRKIIKINIRPAFYNFTIGEINLEILKLILNMYNYFNESVIFKYILNNSNELKSFETEKWNTIS